MMPDVYQANPGRYDDMQYRRSGRSGIKLPAVSLGMWHNFGSVDPYERSVAMVHAAFDRGVTHFDLANNYGPVMGSAEETMGRIMRQSMAPYRHEMFISTKAGYDMWPGPYGEWGSRKYLMNSLEQSLRRMNLEYVDLFYSHRYDPETPIQETLQALVDAVRQGKALYAGISNWPAEPARQAYAYLAEHDVPCLLHQGKYNMLTRGVEREGILADAANAGVGFIAYSPLAQGLLTERYLDGGIPTDSRMAKAIFLRPDMLTPELLERLHRLNDIARRRGQSLSQLALSWLLADTRVTSVIIGASSVAQLNNNLDVLHTAPLTPDEMGEIWQLL